MRTGEFDEVGVSDIGISRQSRQLCDRKVRGQHARLFERGNVPKRGLGVSEGRAIAWTHAHADETLLGEWTGAEHREALQPNASVRVPGVRTPAASQQKVYVQQVAHGKSD